MSIPAPDEISIEDPLCNSSLGSIVTLDYVTPLTRSRELRRNPKLAESSGEFPDVAKSVGEARPRGVAKCKAATRSELALVFSKYIKSVSTSELVELMITARKAFSCSEPHRQGSCFYLLSLEQLRGWSRLGPKVVIPDPCRTVVLISGGRS